MFDVENTGLPSTRAAAVDVVNITNSEPVAGQLHVIATYIWYDVMSVNSCLGYNGSLYISGYIHCPA